MNETQKPLTLSRFEIDNFMRITHFEMDADGGVIEIAGANGNGKSAVLAAWDAMIAGAGAVPEKPVHAGEERYRISGTFSCEGKPEYIVTITGRDDGKPTMKIERCDGKPFEGGKQTFLDDLTGCVPFDATEFARMKPADQRARLMQLVGLDFTKLDYELQQARKQRESMAPVKKRTRGAADTAPYHGDAPKAEVSVADLSLELTKAQEAEVEFERKRGEYERAKSMIKAAQAEIEQFEKRLQQAREDLARAEIMTSKAKDAAENVPEFDIEGIRTKLAGAEAINRKVRDNARRTELVAEAVKVEKEYDAFTARIEAMEAEKLEAIGNATFPYPGLGFTDDGVTLNGVPFDQGSQAEKVLAGAAIFFGILKAQKRRIRHVNVTDGALLDATSRAKLRAMAKDAGGEGFLEVVEVTGQTAIVMVAGESKRAGGFQSHVEHVGPENAGELTPPAKGTRKRKVTA
jgi:hypothetical protein